MAIPVINPLMAVGIVVVLLTVMAVFRPEGFKNLALWAAKAFAVFLAVFILLMSVGYYTGNSFVRGLVVSSLELTERTADFFAPAVADAMDPRNALKNARSTALAVSNVPTVVSAGVGGLNTAAAALAVDAESAPEDAVFSAADLANTDFSRLGAIADGYRELSGQEMQTNVELSPDSFSAALDQLEASSPGATESLRGQLAGLPDDVAAVEIQPGRFVMRATLERSLGLLDDEAFERELQDDLTRLGGGLKVDEERLAQAMKGASEDQEGALSSRKAVPGDLAEGEDDEAPPWAEGGEKKPDPSLWGEEEPEQPDAEELNVPVEAAPKPRSEPSEPSDADKPMPSRKFATPPGERPTPTTGGRLTPVPL